MSRWIWGGLGSQHQRVARKWTQVRSSMGGFSLWEGNPGVVFFFFLIGEIFLGSRAGLDEPLRLSKARAFLWQGGRGCPPAPACAKGGSGSRGSAAEPVAQTTKET